MNPNKRPLFFDVDTQIDFVEPDGALAVPGADALKDNFRKLIDYAHQNRIPVWGSVDAHSPDDAELARNNGPFPNHCMLGEQGQMKIPETANDDILWVDNRQQSPRELDRIRQHPGPVYFRKQSFNVFDNPVINQLIEPYNPIIVFGVATDYCVLAAVKGFLGLGKKVYLITDAIEAVNLKPDDGEKALQEMKQLGAIFIETGDITRRQLFIE